MRIGCESRISTENAGLRAHETALIDLDLLPSGLIARFPGKVPTNLCAFASENVARMAVEGNDREEDSRDEEPISAFHARARKVMQEDREVLDALDQ